MVQRSWERPLPQDFDAVVCDGPRGARLVLAGEIDLTTAPRFEHCLHEFIRTTEHDVEVDASRLTFVDSAGVAILAATTRMLARSGRQLVIRRSPPFLSRLLDITGVSNSLYLDRSQPGIPGSSQHPAGRGRTAAEVARKAL